MNHATQYYFRDYQDSQSTETTADPPTVGQVCRLDTAPKRCRRNKEGQNEISARGNAANAFLRTTFLPKLAQTKHKIVPETAIQLERDFYRSLSQLTTHYNLTVMETQPYGYPYNISLALDDLMVRLKSNVRHWENIKLVQDRGKAFLISEERYDTGTTLYYIPVAPLYRMMNNKKRRKAALLLLSVCSYLYHTVAIPYYTNNLSYLKYMYEMTVEWVLCDDYTDETPTYLGECKQAELVGERMEQKIFNYNNLTYFKQRLDSFKSSDRLDGDCFTLATEAMGLFEKYPNERIFGNAEKTGQEDEDDDEENIVRMDKYVSFSADNKGLLYQNVIEAVNAELQEYTNMEEPVIIKQFDGGNIRDNCFDFESRVFALINNLVYVLNNF